MINAPRTHFMFDIGTCCTSLPLLLLPRLYLPFLPAPASSKYFLTPTVSHTPQHLHIPWNCCIYLAWQDLWVRGAISPKRLPGPQGEGHFITFAICLTHPSAQSVFREGLVNMEAVTSGSVRFVIIFYVTSLVFKKNFFLNIYFGMCLFFCWKEHNFTSWSC